MKHKSTIMIPVIFFSFFVSCLPVHANDTTIYGCYKKIGGQLRVVGEGGKCLPSELPISWTQTSSPSPADTGGSVVVRQIEAGSCTGGYGWCPDGFKWLFRLLDPVVNGNSVVSINVVNPLLYDYGCEVATKGAGEILIFCIGDDYVKPAATLQYAIFNP